MMPVMRQRWLIAVGVLIGSLCWLGVGGYLHAADGSSGISLWSSRVGLIPAILLTAAAGVPVLLIGLLCSASGHPLSGVFAVGASLIALAVSGGPIDGWMYRVSLPGAYGFLLLEMLLWQAGVVVMFMVIQRLRSPLRTRWPALAFSDHLGVDTELGLPELKALAAGGICATVGGTVAWVMVRNTDGGQVLGSLMLAFGLGGMLAQLIVPHNNPVGILCGPALVGAVAYAYVLINYTQPAEVIRAWHHDEIPGIALVLPIHYMSAAVAGSALGVGMAQGFEAAKSKTQAA